MAVPQVRTAVHNATAPRAYAKPKTRVRQPAGTQTASAQAPCAEVPAVLMGRSLAPFAAPETLSFLPSDLVGPDLASTNSGGSPPRDRLRGSPLINSDGPALVAPNPAVPEPATWMQLLLGFGIMGGVARISLRGSERDDESDPTAPPQNGLSPMTLPPSA